MQLPPFSGKRLFFLHFSMRNAIITVISINDATATPHDPLRAAHLLVFSEAAMDITVFPGQLNGTVAAIASKSQVHRYLICAAFADQPTHIIFADTNRDIEATIACLTAIGVEISRTSCGYLVTPADNLRKQAKLFCADSGSTLRFLLPIVGALGIEAIFTMTGRLGQRPLAPLLDEMTRMGCRFSRLDENTLSCSGQLRPGEYRIPGNISSQFISGLLFACTLLGNGSHVIITSPLESKPYVDMTITALSHFGIDANKPIIHASRLKSPGTIAADGDWSNAACYFSANTMGSSVAVIGLDYCSSQGDRAIATFLQQLERDEAISLADHPDLFPILAVAAAYKHGAVFHHIRRLRHKESDRIDSVLAMLHALGCQATVIDDCVRIFPGKFHSCTVNTYHDHRIAMAAAIAATCADGPVTIQNAGCVDKSYPRFWMDFRNLGGIYE